MQKYSVTLKGHRTSISLEPLFWEALNHFAKIQKKAVSTLISDIEEELLKSHSSANLSSFIRIYILQELLKHHPLNIK
ncbi:MAG: ribbon-helix-helix domain-containing protein [Proteobacteria bacterium]|nr:ribbon-helix-helix domain-containing protein [Pseudomonadota bacterium]